MKEAVPGMLYCHGGGFFLPTQPMMVKLAAQYARELGIRVFLPEYRILPDYPNPVPFQDCLSVWNWIQSNGTELNTDVEKLLLYGESAGGTLAAGLALWQRENLGHKAVGQMLIYPALDNRFSRYSSMRQYSEAAWPLKNNLIMWKQYLKNGAGEREDYIIPMKAQDVSNLPPAYVEVQQFDILHDEAAAYAQRLQNAGVPTRLSEIEGSYHGFDADTENPFVQSVVRQRIRAMVEMLKIV